MRAHVIEQLRHRARRRGQVTSTERSVPDDRQSWMQAGAAPTWLRLAVVALASLVLGSWLLVALARIDDSFGTIGPWTGLAFYAANGVFYPPLFDGEHFAGTRYLPLQFLLYAGGSKVTGEYFVSGKIVVALLTAGLLATLYVTLRRVGCSRAIAMGATAATLATAPVLQAGTAIQGDSLALLAQLVAIGAVARRPSHASTVLAGGLCAVALLSKLTAVWAPVAIAIWLTARFRPRAPLFVLSYAGSLLAGLTAIYVLSDGRLLENRSLVSTGTWPGIHDVGVGLPRLFATMMMETAGAVWLLAPIALVGFIVAVRERSLTVYHISAPIALVITLAILNDPGTAWNHLVDVSVLLTIVAAEIEPRASRAGFAAPFVSVLLATLVVGLATGYLAFMSPQLGGSVKGLPFGSADPQFPTPPLADYVSRDDTILSEDASIAVARDQIPVVLDAYMLLRILQDRPEWRRALIRRIDAREFDKVVLLNQLDPTGPWYSRVHFGREVATAIARNYRLETRVGEYYWIHVPRRQPAQPAS